MLRSLSLAIAAFFLTIPAAAQTADPSAPPPAPKAQDGTPSTEAKKPKKVLTNEDLLKTNGKISVVGDTREQPPKPASPAAATPQYIASVRKQLEKLEKQLEEVNKQITDLKNFNAGEPSTKASGVQLDKRYQREPIEVQIRVLQDKKRDLQTKIDTLYDEARKKGAEPGDLR